MGDKVSRCALFGIPLQRQWSYQNSGDYGPSYYLQTDAPPCDYSFTDAFIATQYKWLTPEEQKRFDPMITRFNPADMYAYKHTERVLRVFPGVFTGIGEFSIHKEFVSAKVSGEVASLTNPAVDSVLAFVGKTGLVVILHNDIDMPMAKDKGEPVYLDQALALLKRHPETTIAWVHAGLGRIVLPVGYGSSSNEGRASSHIDVVERILGDPAFSHVYLDISWDEVAKYVVKTSESLKNTADLFDQFPDRLLFGTDVVAPTAQEFYLAVYNMYGPHWKLLTPETSEKIRMKKIMQNYLMQREKRRSGKV